MIRAGGPGDGRLPVSVAVRVAATASIYDFPKEEIIAQVRPRKVDRHLRKYEATYRPADRSADTSAENVSEEDTQNYSSQRHPDFQMAK
jgi:hypothetical protein